MILQTLLHKIFAAENKKGSILDIKIEDLKELGVTAVALDADNTSSYDRTTDPLPGTAEWVENLKNAGFKVVLLSNASSARAKHLADVYGIPVVGLAAKPLPFGYIRTALQLRMSPAKICMIGDQLFTDIIGANIVGFKTIYVFPHQKEERNKFSFAVRRMLERVIFSYQDKKYNY